MPNQMWLPLFYHFPTTRSHSTIMNLHASFILLFKLTHPFISKVSWLEGGPCGYPNEVIPTGPSGEEGSEEALPERKDLSAWTYFYPHASKQHLVRKSSHSISAKYGASTPPMVPDQEDGGLHCYQTACWIALSLLGPGLWGTAI